MLNNYLKVALRSLSRSKIFTLINVFGLAIGMAASLLIYQYVSYQLSYDRSEISERVFRVQNNYIRRNELIYNSAATFPGVGPAMIDYFTEVMEMGRYYPMGMWRKCNLTYKSNDEITFREEKLAYADPSIIDLLNFQVIQGEGKKAFIDPGRILLSQSTAKRYFGDKDPIGKTILFIDDTQHEDQLEVAGVFEDQPLNVHFKCDVLISYKTLHNRTVYRGNPSADGYETDMGDYSFYTYIRLKDEANISNIANQMPALVDKYKPDYMELNSNNERIRRNEFTFTRLDNIHLDSYLQNELSVNGNRTRIYFLLIIAVFILILAWVNFINLSTTRATERAREVGIRKVLGSNRAMLIRQFLMESLMINLLAFVLALTIKQAIEPYYNQILVNDVSFWQWADTRVWMLITTTLITGSILSGLYPAFVLSSYNPNMVIKGKTVGTGHGNMLRKGLVVFQFVASIGLLTGTVVVYKQLQFMQNHDLGFDKEQLLIIERPADMDQKYSLNLVKMNSFKETLRGENQIASVSGSSIIPGRNILRGLAMRWKNSDRVESIEGVEVDHYFFSTYKMRFAAGNDFNKEETISAKSIILNQSAIKTFGIKNDQAAIGQEILMFNSQPYQVIGVIEDYYHESLRMKRDPMYFILNPWIDNYVTLKVSSADLENTLAKTKEIYQEIFKGNPFEYFFLDQYFEQQYHADQQFDKVFRLFSGLSIFLACLGLLGLSAYTVRQRTSEIGIRKVLGATVYDILMLISKTYIGLILLAGIISIPISYFLLNGWLADFAYSINLRSILFLIPIIITLLLALVSVGFQTIKAANADPVDSLRYE